ncbi:MAG: anhydro-N-acetylmuramic acid kinase [Betaproteobacteria bacterium]|nr:anhydro-N-acetylmuramic acid kinase [Betaproteobacteria bacterium]
MVAQPEYYVGLMSGTSLDGIDCALAAFGTGRPRLEATHFIPYAQSLRERLLRLHTPSLDELHAAALMANELARHYAQAVLDLLGRHGLPPSRVQAIGCHGQTIRHRPEAGYTVQLGNAALLAELTAITTVADFRSRDIAAGGQGAPLVPAFHAAMFGAPVHRVIVNIGGIANLTDLPPGGRVSGFDCGPGNLLMDAWTFRQLGKTYDENGAWAAQGRVLPRLLQALEAHPFFAEPPPKSAGRETFSLPWLMSHLEGQEAPADVQATLLALTARAIAQALTTHCRGSREIYLCGGGARNQALRDAIAQVLPATPVRLTDDLGVDADWVEAFAFAWLARQTLHGEPGNLPAVTGARHPCVLGAIHRAEGGSGQGLAD